jgi:hypothetical protein
MKLPNGEMAQLGRKLELYSLNMEHESGKHKAILFKKRLGITIENKEILETALLNSAIEGDASIHLNDRHGTQYDVRFQMTTETGTSMVLGCWIIRFGEDFPRLIGTYPVKK